MNPRRSLSAKGRLFGFSGVVTALSAGAALALAATTPVGGEIKVNTTAGNHDFAAVAMDADGNFISAFESPDAGAVAIRRFNSLGSPLSPEIPISAPGDINQEDPSVAMNGDGKAVVAWEDGAAAEPDDIKARLIGANGAVVPGIIEVNPTTSNDQDEPQVGMAANGDFVVVWEGEGPGDPDGVFMRRYTAAGAPKGGEVRVNQTVLDTQQSAAVAMNADGEFVVAWHGPDGGGDRDVFARRYTASGTPVTGEFHVNQNVADFAWEPGAGIDAAGNFVVAWAGEEATDPDGGIYFRLFAPGGAPRTGDVLANTTTSDFQGTSDRTGVGMDPRGNFVIAWEDDSAGDPDITARRFDSSGDPLTAELHPNTTTANTQRDARAAAAGNGDFVVAWEGENGSSEVDIVARLYHVPDVTPPLLTLSGKKKQKAKRPVVVVAECDEACLATGTGKVKVKGGAGKARGRSALRGGGETLQLKESSVQLTADQPDKLKLKLKRKDAKRLEKLVEDGAKATAKITVVAVDDSGNSAQGRKKVKLK